MTRIAQLLKQLQETYPSQILNIIKKPNVSFEVSRDLYMKILEDYADETIRHLNPQNYKYVSCRNSGPHVCFRVNDFRRGMGGEQTLSVTVRV